MASPLALYRDPIAMEPLFPSDPSGELEHLATELVRTSAKLSEAMHPVTRAAVAELVRCRRHRLRLAERLQSRFGQSGNAVPGQWCRRCLDCLLGNYRQR